jgi:hypothetical protein
MKTRTHDIIVWDVDETLGSFATFSDIFSAIEYTTNKQLTYEDFRELLDMFPEYLRPKLFKYLRYLKKFKRRNDYKVVIYTNNMGGNYWIDYIKQYIEEKIRGVLFDDVIRSWKSDKRRTSDNKTYGDLQKCLEITDLRHVYFIDDQSHYIKSDKRVNYLQIPAYVIYPNIIDVGTRLLNSKIHERHIKNFPVFIRLLGEMFAGSTHFENQVLYSKMDDKVMENFVHEFVKKTKPKRNKTHKL